MANKKINKKGKGGRIYMFIRPDQNPEEIIERAKKQRLNETVYDTLYNRASPYSFSERVSIAKREIWFAKHPRVKKFAEDFGGLLGIK